MTWLRRYRGFALLPALLWLGMQGVMSAGLIALPADAGSPRSQGLSTLFICAPDGPFEVDVGDLADGGDVPTHDHGAECRWCQAFAVAVVPGRTDRFGIARLPVAAAPALPVTRPRGAGHHPADAFESRAPPV
ncbi:MAG: DUF2946 family protein [Pseudomonadota bacterium]